MHQSMLTLYPIARIIFKSAVVNDFFGAYETRRGISKGDRACSFGVSSGFAHVV
ncbi:hypothetical protein AAE478_003764 [Parahypoxylon ruwenzoriense]